MTERYVELHARSAFSFLEGASVPEAMVQQAANLALPGLAILDRDGFYGSPRLYTSAQKLGLRSHIGAEISVDALGDQVQPPSWQPHSIPGRPVRLSLLCESQRGYRNLSLLISGYKLAQRTKGDGIASFRKLAEHATGLVCMTGGEEGPLAAALERGGMDEGRSTLKRLVHTFGPENVYVELQRHGIPEQEARNQAAISLAHEFHLPLLATNGVSMATEFEREILDVLTSIRHGCSLDEAGLLLQAERQAASAFGSSRCAPCSAMFPRRSAHDRRAVRPVDLPDEGHGLRVSRDIPRRTARAWSAFCVSAPLKVSRGATAARQSASAPHARRQCR